MHRTKRVHDLSLLVDDEGLLRLEFMKQRGDEVASLRFALNLTSSETEVFKTWYHAQLRRMLMAEIDFDLVKVMVCGPITANQLRCSGNSSPTNQKPIVCKLALEILTKDENARALCQRVVLSIKGVERETKRRGKAYYATQILEFLYRTGTNESRTNLINEICSDSSTFLAIIRGCKLSCGQCALELRTHLLRDPTLCHAVASAMLPVDYRLDINSRYHFYWNLNLDVAPRTRYSLAEKLQARELLWLMIGDAEVSFIQRLTRRGLEWSMSYFRNDTRIQVSSQARAALSSCFGLGSDEADRILFRHLVFVAVHRRHPVTRRLNSLLPSDVIILLEGMLFENQLKRHSSSPRSHNLDWTHSDESE